MSSTVRVIAACPHCGKKYRVRVEVVGRRARCSGCRSIFRLTSPQVARVEQQILDWLSEEQQAQPQPVPSAGQSDESDQALPPEGTVAGLRILPGEQEGQANAESPQGPAEVPMDNGLTVAEVDKKKVRFEFPLRALLEPTFRAGLPQLCCNCLSTNQLRIYLVRWEGKIPGLGTLTDKQLAARATVRLADLPPATSVEILNFLPREECLPEPLNLPFPYYVCDRCSSKGLVRGGVNAEDGITCWLQLGNLELGRRFYATVAGTRSKDYRRLLTYADMSRKTRWESLPHGVRRNISQWFQLAAGERFIEYVRDLEGGRLEGGTDGIVLTDRRLVFKKDNTWREFPLSHPVTIMTQLIPDGQRIEIYSLVHGRAVCKLASRCWISLRQELSKLKCQVKIFQTDHLRRR